VLIEGERIVGRQRSADPGGRASHRSRRRHAAPGLIDAHVHLTSESQDDFAKAYVEK